jgi:uncharacterized protein YjdB
LNKNTATITVGGKETLIATVAPANATNKSVSWRSNDETVATVSSSGEVTAVSAGNATITVATADGNRTAICVVTVTTIKFPVAEDYEIEGLSQINDGTRKEVSITAKPGKSPGDITIFYNGSATAPIAIGNYAITFDVAAVSGWFAATGLSGGRLYITAAYVAVTSVTLNKSTTIITEGNKETLTANVLPVSATNKSVSWESSNKAIATVSESGEVTAVSAGTAIITATSDDDISKTAKCTVTVNPPPTAVTFTSVTSDGNSTQTSTMLILNFSAPITGLTASDITLSGVSGVNKGTLTADNTNTSFTLQISNVTASGTLTVAVAKSGYTINAPKSVWIYYAAPPITPATLASHLASLPANTTTNPHNITLKVTSEDEFATIKSSLLAETSKYVYLDLSGSSITTIPSNSFLSYPDYLTSLVGINIPSGVTSIGIDAFQFCFNLTSVIIPNTVTSIEGSAFWDCSSLSIVNIPNSVTSIGNSAFLRCKSLTSVNIPDSVTSIGLETFTGCSSLSSVTIPNSITSIGAKAFEGCTSLTSINIPESVTSIEINTFNGCTSLTNVNIPDSVTNIKGNAFLRCTSLPILIIPNSVTSIGFGAFAECTSLANVTIGNGVTSLTGNTFAGCTNLTRVEFKCTIPSSDFYSFNDYPVFPGDLRSKYLGGGIGTYTRPSGSSLTWTKQP